MSICIIDPAAHMPGLKLLFPEAEYFSHEPDSFFTYISTHHYTKQKNKEEYGFEYRTDWENINSNNFSTVFIVAPLMDYFNVVTTVLTPHLDRMLKKIREIFIQNTFQKICLFDIYDYDYDPNDINTELRVVYYFKRNYNKNKSYKTNVFPFPCSMFVKPCVLSSMLNLNLNNKPSINKAMWAGCLYNHTDNNFTPPIVRNRVGMFEQIKDNLSVYNSLPYSEYIEKIRQHKIIVDLIGVGEPNKRTFEALSNGILLMTMVNDLEWGFYPNDKFHPDTIFTSASDFREKLNRLLNNEAHYQSCLAIQNKLVKKYFNKEWLSLYIKKKIGIHEKVTLFITACKRPDLMYQTMLTFVAYNTYPIEEAYIFEDSGEQDIHPYISSLAPFPVKILYTKKNRGQMRSIENGLQYIKTPFVFHCEDDWEFYDYGFIEKSLNILKKEPLMTSPWLRSYSDRLNNIKYTHGDGYIKFAPEVTNTLSFNPGLRTVETEKMFAPYTPDKLRTLCEGGLDHALYKIGRHAGMTDNVEGYVRHIGWHRHVYNTLGIEKF